jgi:hypothetical protein
MAEWKGGDWRNRSRESALPLTELQSHVLEALAQYQRHAGALGGVWPSSPEISHAMLERYKKQNGNGKKPKASDLL